MILCCGLTNSSTAAYAAKRLALSIWTVAGGRGVEVTMFFPTCNVPAEKLGRAVRVSGARAAGATEDDMACEYQLMVSEKAKSGVPSAFIEQCGSCFYRYKALTDWLTADC